MPKNIIFTNHALERMKERFIGKKTVIGAINNPDKIERSFQNPSQILIKKLYFNKKLKKDHLLMIICETKQKYIKVITIIDTSKISKYF